MNAETQENRDNGGVSSADQAFWAQSPDEVAETLNVSLEEGLSPEQIKRRREAHGENRLGRARGRSSGRILFEQFKSITILILSIAAVLSLALGHWPEGLAVVGVILVNAGIGFFSEWRASQEMQALRKIAQPEARVRRAEGSVLIPIERIVPGDVAILEAGDVVPADIRLVEANGLQVDESALSGESASVAKQTEAVAEDAPLAQRSSMVYRATTVTEGSGEGIVVGIGRQTQLGQIARMTQAAQQERTPLEDRLERLGRHLALLALAAATLIAVAGVSVGQPLRLIIATSVALGVAAVPEGLPIVANLALAKGMWLMSRRNAIINRLPAVETLGATDVIFSDKTGTLTENRMRVDRIVTGAMSIQAGNEGLDMPKDEDPTAMRVLEVGVLCNNASLDQEQEGGAQGDPTEIALLRAGRSVGIERPALLKDKPETREVAFDPDVMMMATFHRVEEGFEEAVKGAPDSVLDCCDRLVGPEGERELSSNQREQWMRQAEEMADSGLRVLAVADAMRSDETDDPYSRLRLLGLVGLYDPPRKDVGELIKWCTHAGVRVVMVTGDQPATARSIARQIGIAADEVSDVLIGRDLPDASELSDRQRRDITSRSVFARFSPGRKLELIKIFKQQGHTVAMTGDGINDTPALKSADIGVAMGRRGTDAAREASDMVLQDDAFSSIVDAIRQGRIIFGNIRKAVMFMICTNVAEVLAVAAASVAGWPIPLLPLQILYLNMLADVLPAFALGVGRGHDDVMHQPPRDPSESILTRPHWLAIGSWASIIALCVLSGMTVGHVALDLAKLEAVTISFLTLGYAKLWFVLNLRGKESRLFHNTILRNRWIWGSWVLCALLLVAAVYMPGLSDLLRTRWIDWRSWMLVAGLSLVPVLLGQVLLVVRSRRAGEPE